jgi:glycosyltransferase involved in cell wall biosynthesis
VPEVIDEGLTGFVVDSVDAAVAAVAPAVGLDRLAIRRRFEQRFTAERMARDYMALYGEVLRRTPVTAVVRSTGAVVQRDAA